MPDETPGHAKRLDGAERISGWRRAGPWRSGRAYSRVCGAATAFRPVAFRRATGTPSHVRVARRQDPRFRKVRPSTSSGRTRMVLAGGALVASDDGVDG